MTGRGRKGEFELIAHLFAPLAEAAPGALGLKDDAAFLRITPGHELVLTCDTVIAGSHFLKTDPPDMVAQKALRVNLSDLAAKGAKPVGFLHALALNDSIDDAYLERYAAGLKADVAAFGIPLLGGDTTSGEGPLTITITALGEVPIGQMIQRTGAKPGDVLCVTGTIGDGGLGLAVSNGALKLPQTEADHLTARYRLPQPRLMVGQGLVGIATACLDISDGLGADIGHICTASGVAAVIERDLVPLSAAARAAVNQDPRWWNAVLGGGDDYELGFTVAPDNLAKAKAAGEKAGVPVTVIGKITAGAGVTLLADGKQRIPDGTRV